MKVKADEYYRELPREEVINQLKNLNEYNPDDGITKMRIKNAKLPQDTFKYGTTTLHLQTLENCLYDPAIYMMDEEYKDTAGKVIDVQTEIENPHC